MRTLSLIIVAALICFSWSLEARAGVLSQVLKEAGEAIVQKGATEVIEYGSKSAAKSMAKEAAEAAAKRAASRTVLRFSDDALRLAGSSDAALALADDAAIAAAKLSPRNARRLAMMADDIEASGKAAPLLKHLAQHAAADECVDFLWRNKGTIASGAAIAAVMVNPEIITEPTSRIGEAIVETAGREIVHPLTGGTTFGAWAFVIIGVFVIAGGLSPLFRSQGLHSVVAWAKAATSK